MRAADTWSRLRWLLCLSALATGLFACGGGGGGGGGTAPGAQGRTWFVDTARATGDGSFATPFPTLAAATGAAAAGDTIFVFDNGANPVNANTAITLKAGQKLLGEGVAFTDGTVVVPAGARPILSFGALTPVVTLADNTEVAGFQIVSGNADPESGAVLGNGVSAVNVHDNLIPDAAGVGVNLTNVSGTTRVANNTITNSGEDGISIAMGPAAVNGQMTVTGNTVTGSGGLGAGIIAEISGTSQLTLALTANQVSGSTGEAGVFLLSADTSQLKARVTGNTLQDNQGAVGQADFGARSRHTSTLCLEFSQNTSNAAAGILPFLAENDSLGAPGATFQFFQANNQGGIETAGVITTVPAGTCGVP